MPATKFEKGKVTEKVDPKVLGVLSAAFGYKISGVDDLDYEEYHNELREAMERGKGNLSPAQMAVLSSERTRIRAQKSVYKADFKKTTMTAADIKRGSAIQLAERSASSLYKGGVGQSPVEEDIHEPLDEILRLLKEEHQFDKDKAESARKKAEDEARARKEKNLERWNSLKKTASKVVKPFRSLWDKIWGFLKTIILGNILMKILNWMGDKKNQEKLKNIFKFMEDWWPTLLAAYLLFGNSLGRMIVKLTAKVAVWTVKIVSQLIPQLIAALTKLKTGKLLRMLGGKRSRALLMTGGILAATPGLVNRLGDGGEEGDTTQKFNQGGVVRGQGGVDKVPAQLTAGEFVMSKGAVQKYGVDTLAAMNAAGGGTNTPTLGGLPGLGGGGGGTDALTEQAKVKTFGSALGDFFSGDDGRSRRMTPQERSQEMTGGGLVQGFSGGGPVTGGYDGYSDEVKAEIKKDNEELAKLDKIEISPATILKGAEYAYFKNGKDTGIRTTGAPLEATKRERLLAKMKILNAREKKIKLSPDEISEVNKERAIGGQPPFKGGGAIVPLPSSITPVPGPPVQKTNLMSMVSEQQSKDSSSASTDNSTKVPEIDAEAKISENKIKVLGISI